MRKKLSIIKKVKLYFINKSYKKLNETLKTCDYSIYLETDHWKFFSSEKRKNAKYKCEICGEKGIEVHHKTYEHRGFETFNDVLCLCHKCHMEIHNGKPAHLDSRYKYKNFK